MQTVFIPMDFIFLISLLLIEFEENGEITIVWCGSHDEYELTFKNNKNTIRNWLKEKNWIN